MLLACAVLSASFSCSSFKSLVFHVKHLHETHRIINFAQPNCLYRFRCLCHSFLAVFLLILQQPCVSRETCHIDEPHPTDLLMLLAYTVLSASFSCSSFKSLVFHVKRAISMNHIRPICLCCWLVPFFPRRFLAHPSRVLCFT